MDDWLKKLASMVYLIFTRPYNDKPDYVQKTIGRTKITVQRPNHGFLHSMRQAILAYNICNAMLPYIHFGEIKKIMMLAAFQRSGRESEVSSKQDYELYHSYEKQDTRVFRNTAHMHKYLFTSTEEIDQLSQCIYWKNRTMVSKIIRTAHILYLRRIPSFDMNRVRREACMCLFDNLDQSSRDIINKLFTQSGKYLASTGDRDAYIQKKHVDDKFYVLSTNQDLCTQLFNILVRK